MSNNVPAGISYSAVWTVGQWQLAWSGKQDWSPILDQVIANGGASIVPAVNVAGTFTGNGSIGIPVPANAIITAASIRETNNVGVTVNLGTTSGASDILAGAVIPGDGIVPIPSITLLVSAWTAPQTIFVSASSWGGASVTVTVWYLAP